MKRWLRTSVTFLACLQIAKAFRPMKTAFASSSLLLSSSSEQGAPEQEKKIVFLRHGCTYMNEYLGRSISFGAPNFSDVFSHKELSYYQDTPLSPLGVRQAQQLQKSRPSFVNDLDLMVVSPLTRALQTFSIGIKPHLDPEIPVLALPHAAERLYLISDVGRPASQLQQEFDSIDFETAMDDDVWWYQHTDGHYEEWRPTGRGQRYACKGEPQSYFNERMTRLYKWLDDRPESNIGVVCHHGVIDWMLDMDFDNCQWQETNFARIQPRALAASQHR